MIRRLALSTFGWWTWRAVFLRASRLIRQATYIQSGRPTAAASSSVQTETGLGISIRNHRAAPEAKKRFLNQRTTSGNGPATGHWTGASSSIRKLVQRPKQIYG